MLRPGPRPQGDVHPPAALHPAPPKEALRRPALRYLTAYGPATPHHFARWLAAPSSWATALFTRLAAEGEVEEVLHEDAQGVGAAGDTHFHASTEESRGVLLLPCFDAYAIAARPRERLYPGRAWHRALSSGQAGTYPVLLNDGEVRGVRHQRRRGDRTTATVEPLTPLTAHQSREPSLRTERIGEFPEATPDSVIGGVTTGPHAEAAPVSARPRTATPPRRCRSGGSRGVGAGSGCRCRGRGACPGRSVQGGR